MDRRDFLKTTGAVAITAGSVPASADAHSPAPALPSGTRRLLVSMGRPAATPAGFDLLSLIRSIETASQGRLQFEFAAPEADSDIGLDGASSAHPAFAFFAGLPGAHGLDMAEQHAWLTVGGGQMLWDDLAAAHGFKPLLVGHSGISKGVWTSIPLERTSHFAGLSIHATGLAQQVLAALGAAPVEYPPAMIETALADGRMDAAEWLGPLGPVAAGSQRPLASRLYAPGPTTAGLMLSLRVRRPVWDTLGAAERAIFQACATEAYQRTVAEGRMISLLEGEPVPTPLPFSAEIRAALEAAATGIIARIADTDPEARRIHDSYQAFRRLTGKPPIA